MCRPFGRESSCLVARGFVHLGETGHVRPDQGNAGCKWQRRAIYTKVWRWCALSGSTGSMIGNPFDVMKTMMMANSKEKVPLPALMGKMLGSRASVGFTAVSKQMLPVPVY